jgi:hypothetical protein
VTTPPAVPAEPPEESGAVPSSFDVGADRWSPRRARDRVYDFLRASAPAGSLTDDSEFDLLLCTSELVNAALLAGCTQMTLQVAGTGGRLRIAVLDDTPVAQGNTPSAQAQRDCLRVVATVADRWRSEPRESGRITWAEFDTAFGTDDPV